MARPDFETSIASRVKYSYLGSPQWDILVPDAKFSEEVQSGTTRRKPQGWLPPTGYSFLHRDYVRAFGSSKWNSYYGYDHQYTGCIGSAGGGRFNSLNHFNEVLPESDLTSDDLVSAALIAARIKLKRSSVNLGVAFAERKMTARLIGDTAINIARSFTALRRGQTRNAMNLLGITSKKREPRAGNVPGKWLELQYGWKPLLSDVYGAEEALEKQPLENWRVTATATRSKKKTGVKRFPDFESGLGVATADISVFVRLDALPGNELTGSLASLGITNPLLIGWELVPYSFVVDWFIPVGKWLESLDALLGYESAYSSISSLVRAEWYGTGTSEELFGAGVIDNSYTEKKKLVKLIRSVSDDVPLPTFPRIKDPRSLGHMANGLALLAQAFRR